MVTDEYFTPLKDEKNVRKSTVRWTEEVTIEEPENYDFIFKPAALKKKDQEEGRAMAAPSKYKITVVDLTKPIEKTEVPTKTLT